LQVRRLSLQQSDYSHGINKVQVYRSDWLNARMEQLAVVIAKDVFITTLDFIRARI
jgi:hypothetical protein